MSDLSLTLLAGAVVVVTLAWSLVSQSRRRRGHLSDTRRRNLNALGTCPAWFEDSDGRLQPCARERVHVGYHHWRRSEVTR